MVDAGDRAGTELDRFIGVEVEDLAAGAKQGVRI
jgi:hypothetical protein